MAPAPVVASHVARVAGAVVSTRANRRRRHRRHKRRAAQRARVRLWFRDGKPRLDVVLALIKRPNELLNSMPYVERHGPGVYRYEPRTPLPLVERHRIALDAFGTAVVDVRTGEIVPHERLPSAACLTPGT